MLSTSKQTCTHAITITVTSDKRPCACLFIRKGDNYVRGLIKKVTRPCHRQERFMPWRISLFPTTDENKCCEFSSLGEINGNALTANN